MDADDRLSWQHKGLPPGREVRLGELPTLGWNVLAGDTGTPVAVLRAGALANNLAVMAEYCRRRQVWLAPHAKTAMSPELTAMQAGAGAWGFTAAVPHQVAALLEFGIQRIILANEVTDPGALRWLAALFANDPQPELIWYVDSLASVALAEEALPVRPAGRRPRVLVELGHPGGRTGARTVADALEVAGAVHASQRLDLAGLAGFEGTVSSGPALKKAGLPTATADERGRPGSSPPPGDPRDPQALARVDAFLALIRDAFTAMHERELFVADASPIITAGGSVYFDRVIDAFEPLRASGAHIVLRSGCYLSHDDGLYDRESPAHAAHWELDAFQAAIEVWGRVLSRPEPGLALVNFGRRDVSFDAGLPVPRWFCRRGAGRAEPAEGLLIIGLSDQHAFVQVPDGHPIAVGDLLGAGVSHPCTTFDRWRLLLLADDDYQVTGGVRTYF